MSDSAATYKVSLFAGLEGRCRDTRAYRELTVDEAPTIAAVLDLLGLGSGVTGLVLVNGLHAGADDVLGAGDEVSLFPPLGGG
jgi:molybdopterin converting factor small subunit